MSDLNHIPILDEDVPIEVAFWEANKEDLSRRYPGKYLVIRGEEVSAVLNNSVELRIAEEQDLADNPALVRFVYEDEPVLSPFSQGAVRA